MSTSTRPFVSSLALTFVLSTAAAPVLADPLLQHDPPAAAHVPPSPQASLESRNWAALRAWFHRPEFNVTDGLATYAEDYRLPAVVCADCTGSASREHRGREHLATTAQRSTFRDSM